MYDCAHCVWGCGVCNVCMWGGVVQYVECIEYQSAPCTLEMLYSSIMVTSSNHYSDFFSLHTRYSSLAAAYISPPPILHLGMQSQRPSGESTYSVQ